LRNANLQYINLQDADLRYCKLQEANLEEASLQDADLRGCSLWNCNLQRADLRGANLQGANLQGANLRKARLEGANLQGASGLVKRMGVTPGNCYWKRLDAGLKSLGYQFHVGLNTLRPGEVFESDDRLLDSFPGFHFASRSWCAEEYPDRPLEALIQIPEDAQVNEPWASDGAATADKIVILKVFDTSTGADVTDRYRTQ
jgi:hypothetical protein